MNDLHTQFAQTKVNKNMRQFGVAHEIQTLFMSDEEKHAIILISEPESESKNLYPA